MDTQVKTTVKPKYVQVPTQPHSIPVINLQQVLETCGIPPSPGTCGVGQVTMDMEAFASVAAATLQQYQLGRTQGSVSIDELPSTQCQWVAQLKEQNPRGWGGRATPSTMFSIPSSLVGTPLVCVSLSPKMLSKEVDPGSDIWKVVTETTGEPEVLFCWCCYLLIVFVVIAVTLRWG